MTPVHPEEQRNGRRPGNVHLEDYWRVIWKRGWLVVAVTVVALGAAIWAASRRPQLYEARLTLQVGDPRGRTGQIGDLDVSPNLLWTDPIESEVQQLTTQAVAQYVVDSLQLRAKTPGTPRPELLDAVRVGSDAPAARYRLDIDRTGTVSVFRSGRTEPLAHGTTGNALHFNGVHITPRSEVQPGSYELHIVAPQAASARVRGGLAASPRPETNLIDVTYTDADPAMAPEILNASAAATRALGVRRIRRWAEQRTGFIGEQLQQAGQELQRALEAVEAYKERRNLTSLSSEENRLLRRLGELQSRMEQLVIARNTYVDVIDRIRTADAIGPDDVQQLAALTDEAENRAIQFYFDRLLSLVEERGQEIRQEGKDPSHPQVTALDARIAETQERLLSAARQGASALNTRIAAIRESLDRLRAELAQLPALETELARLQNQVEIHTDMYKFLLSRYQESQIAEAEISPYVDLVDPASWARPIGGGGYLNIVFGGLLGLLLGVALAFFLEYLDRSVQSTDDVETELGVPVLGWIPKIAGIADTRIPLVTIQHPEAPAAEAYRVLRTNLAFSTVREQRLTTLVVTSPGPAEGKSTTVANLANVLAGRGDRTLLIDADLRRGHLHQSYELLRSPGLSDLLTSEIDSHETIRRNVRPGLDILPAGPYPPNPSELLGSTVMSAFLEQQRSNYRWILIDTPPVLAVSDPTVIAARTDAAVLVIKIGETDRRAAWRSIEQLRKVDVRIVGAVLNEIERGRSQDGYHIDHYYSRYAHAPESAGVAG